MLRNLLEFHTYYIRNVTLWFVTTLLDDKTKCTKWIVNDERCGKLHMDSFGKDIGSHGQFEYSDSTHLSD